MSKFDEPYYERFYEARRSRVQGPEEVARLATVVATIIEATHGPLASALEIGAGTGLLAPSAAPGSPVRTSAALY